MQRNSAGTFIGLGLVLMIAGAIMRYAVTVHTSGFSINIAGLIALIAGLVSLMIGLLLLLLPARRSSVTTERYVSSPRGQEYIQERDDIDGV